MLGSLFRATQSSILSTDVGLPYKPGAPWLLESLRLQWELPSPRAEHCCGSGLGDIWLPQKLWVSQCCCFSAWHLAGNKSQNGTTLQLRRIAESTPWLQQHHPSPGPVSESDTPMLLEFHPLCRACSIPNTHGRNFIHNFLAPNLVQKMAACI